MDLVANGLFRALLFVNGGWLKGEWNCWDLSDMGGGKWG